MRKLRILFVCPADVSTAQSFIATMAADGRLDVLVFDSSRRGPFPPQKWRFPTFSLFCSPHPENGFHRWIGLPDNKYLRFLVQRNVRLFAFFLRWVIRFYRPDIVHTMGINPEAWISRLAILSIASEQRPKWVVTSWSADVYWDRFKDVYGDRLRLIIRDLDWFVADCKRDLRVAEELGLKKSQILVDDGIPGVGSVISQRATPRTGRKRLSILLPKAYDGVYHKPYAMLEALSRIRRRGFRFEAHVVGASVDVQIWCRLRDPGLHASLHFHDYLPREEYLEMIKTADIVLAPSLTDGTPNALLEAMACGALPIFSDHESIKEWIRDGFNGLLVDPIDCRSIELQLAKVFRDPALIARAAGRNAKIIDSRTNPARVREIVLSGYEFLLGGTNQETASVNVS